MRVGENKLKEVLLFLDAELPKFCQSTKFASEEVDDQELVSFLENDDKLKKLKKKLFKIGVSVYIDSKI